MDGHLWIERDGKIIDPYFGEYTFVKIQQGLTDEIVYLEASPEIQQKILKYLEPDVKYANKKMTPEQIAMRPLEGACQLNAVLEQKRNGGRIVFGSMGWKRKNGQGVYYAFGGEDYTTVKHFLPRRNGLRTIKQVLETRAFLNEYAYADEVD